MLEKEGLFVTMNYPPGAADMTFRLFKSFDPTDLKLGLE